MAKKVSFADPSKADPSKADPYGSMINGEAAVPKQTTEPKAKKAKKAAAKKRNKRARTVNHSAKRTNKAAGSSYQHKLISLEPETMQDVKDLASLKGITANELIKNAIQQYLAKEYTPDIKAAASKLKKLIQNRG